MSYTVALLINTCNWPDALNLVLKSVHTQTKLPNEILIADGNPSTISTKIIKQFTELTSIPVQHIVLEKTEVPGKSKILNRAIFKSQSDYIIQINGNCILHKNFIKDHIKKAKPNIFLYGSTVPISSKYVDIVITKEIIKFNYFSRKIKQRNRKLRFCFLPSFTKPINYFSDEMVGNNISFWKEDFMDINGYNEDFKNQTGEDIDFFYRLLFSGAKGKKLSHTAILYSLPNPHAIIFDSNNAIIKNTRKHKVIMCENGVNKVKKAKKMSYY